MSPEPPDIPREYANLIGSHWGPADLTVDFGFQLPNHEPPHWIVGITMSWEETRVLHRILCNALSAYEDAIGPIRDIEGMPLPPQNGSHNGGPHDGDESDDDLEGDPGDH